MDVVETRYKPSEEYFRLGKAEKDLNTVFQIKIILKNKNKQFIKTEPELLISRPVIESEEEQKKRFYK